MKQGLRALTPVTQIPPEQMTESQAIWYEAVLESETMPDWLDDAPVPEGEPSRYDARQTWKSVIDGAAGALSSREQQLIACRWGVGILIVDDVPALLSTINAHEREAQRMRRALYVLYLKSLPYPDYLQSLWWRLQRSAKIAEAGDRCQLCNKSGDLQVHHRTYERLGEEWPRDLIALCGDCHAKFHDKLPAPPA